MDSWTSYRYYPALAFVAGVLLTLGFKDVYPDLQRRFLRYKDIWKASKNASQSNHIEFGQQTSALGTEKGQSAILEGIEGAIGRTPLIRIKSLSDKTGCEILGKCEVNQIVIPRDKFVQVLT